MNIIFQKNTITHSFTKGDFYMLCDFHVHTCMSSDSDADIDRVIQAAIRLGMTHLCITDHHDIDYKYKSEELKFLLDSQQYYQTLSKYREKYKGQINLLIGVEMGLQPHIKKETDGFLSSVPLDFVIGSSHVINGIDPYYEDIWKKYNTKQVMQMYFENIFSNLEVHDNFDVYGHLDYAIQYAREKDRDYSYKKYKNIIDSILIKIIKMGKGIEINSSGLRKGLKSTLPCFEIIEQYYRLGGEIITVGSDAHIPQDVGADFDRVKDLLIEAGFRHYNLFIGRKPVDIPLK